MPGLKHDSPVFCPSLSRASPSMSSRGWVRHRPQGESPSSSLISDHFSRPQCREHGTLGGMSGSALHSFGKRGHTLAVIKLFWPSPEVELVDAEEEGAECWGHWKGWCQMSWVRARGTQRRGDMDFPDRGSGRSRGSPAHSVGWAGKEGMVHAILCHAEELSSQGNREPYKSVE